MQRAAGANVKEGTLDGDCGSEEQGRYPRPLHLPYYRGYPPCYCMDVTS